MFVSKRAHHACIIAMRYTIVVLFSAQSMASRAPPLGVTEYSGAVFPSYSTACWCRFPCEVWACVFGRAHHACISARWCMCCVEFPLGGPHFGCRASSPRTLFCSTVLLFGVMSNERLHFRVSGESISGKRHARSRAFLTNACQFCVPSRISA